MLSNPFISARCKIYEFIDIRVYFIKKREWVILVVEIKEKFTN